MANMTAAGRLDIIQTTQQFQPRYTARFDSDRTAGSISGSHTLENDSLDILPASLSTEQTGIVKWQNVEEK